MELICEGRKLEVRGKETNEKITEKTKRKNLILIKAEKLNTKINLAYSARVKNTTRRNISRR